MNYVKPIFAIIACLGLAGCMSGCSRQMSSGSPQPSNPCHDIPLINAAYDHNGYSQAQALLSQGTNVNIVNSCGQTALTVAAQLDNVDMVELFIKHGAKIDDRTSSSATPLVLAASGGNIQSAKLLLDHGADVEAKKSAWTPLIAAVDNNINVGVDPERLGPQELLDMEKLLIAHGANVNESRGGKTALMIARRRHFAQTVVLLKQAGAKR